MIRTIVYAAPEQPRGGLEAAEAGSDERPDGYLEKLLKYVPAEILAFFVPAAAAAKDDARLSWVVFVLSILATIGYVRFHAEQLPKDKRPRPHYYGLAAVAFVFWAMGSSETVRHLLKVSATTTEVLLGIAVLLLPLVDWLLAKAFGGAKVSEPPAGS